jgi:thiamine-phosphate pyrophosphorylase
MPTNVAAVVRLMLVTDDQLLRGRDLVQLALAAERGGVTSVQVRLKHSTPRDLAGLVRSLVGALKVPVLVNDRPDVALAAGAAGAHLGPDDMPVRLARSIAPPGFLLGASVGSEAEADGAAEADYWGVGPWRTSPTKSDAGDALGAAGFGRIVRLAGPRPCIAIGAVHPDDVAGIAGSGGKGVAVVSGILSADDIETAARRYAVEVRKALPL